MVGFDELSNMTSYFPEFRHTANGVTCSDSGFLDLFTAQECAGTVNYAKSFNSKACYKSEICQGGSPKGCFILDSGFMYFNNHSTGRASSSSSSICMKGNT